MNTIYEFILDYFDVNDLIGIDISFYCLAYLITLGG